MAALQLVAAIFFLFLTNSVLHAQFLGRQTGCYTAPIIANPNRPTVANPADITQYGVLEVEYGWDGSWPASGIQGRDIVSLIKFGLLCDVELRWASTNFLSRSDSLGYRNGFGDNWIGPQVRFYRQTARVPSLAVSYEIKFPSASQEKGLGSGRQDHAFVFLASKDVYEIHFDFNATYFLIGRQNGSGFDRDVQLDLSFSHVLRGPLWIAGEVYGSSRLNADTPGFASTLWALTYNFSPRCVMDAGIDVGIGPNAPDERVFAGVTYSIANLYSALKPSSHLKKGQ